MNHYTINREAGKNIISLEVFSIRWFVMKFYNGLDEHLLVQTKLFIDIFSRRRKIVRKELMLLISRQKRKSTFGLITWNNRYLEYE